MAQDKQKREDTGMIIDPDRGYVTVMGVDFGVGFLSLLVVAARQGAMLLLKLKDGKTIVAHRVD